MKKKYFGIAIKENRGFDIQNIAARLFVCPRISTEHASKMLDMIMDGTLPIAKFEDKTSGYIDDLYYAKTVGDREICQSMNNKLKEWSKAFGAPTAGDYKYLKAKFGFTKSDLFGTDTEKEHSITSAKEMAALVKQYIKGQDEAVDKLAVPFFQHLDSKRKEYTCRIKTPVLLMGPTGIGKSEMLRVFGKICDCPIVRINSSEIVPYAWKGLHINDVLAKAINGKVSAKDLEYAVIVFHEFDKITHFDNKSVSSKSADIDADMMRDIMRMFETEYRINLENATDPQTMLPETYQLPTDNLLIVFDGAFYGIENIIRKRLNAGSSIGYANKTEKERYEGVNLQKLVNNDDLVKWGYMPELLGRIGNIVVMNPLTTDVIYEIMTSAKDNILQAHIDYCLQNNIKLRFDDDALRYIAAEAYKSGLGFRNVKTLISKALDRMYFELPKNVSPRKRVVKISKEYVMRNINAQ